MSSAHRHTYSLGTVPTVRPPPHLERYELLAGAFGSISSQELYIFYLKLRS